jgi:hypothetical protein
MGKHEIYNLSEVHTQGITDRNALQLLATPCDQLLLVLSGVYVATVLCD